MKDIEINEGVTTGQQFAQAIHENFQEIIPTMTDARTPKAHGHPANQITGLPGPRTCFLQKRKFPAVAGINAYDVADLDLTDGALVMINWMPTPDEMFTITHVGELYTITFSAEITFAGDETICVFN